jgi:hypothetical protein
MCAHIHAPQVSSLLPQSPRANQPMQHKGSECSELCTGLACSCLREEAYVLKHFKAGQRGIEAVGDGEPREFEGMHPP